MIDSIVMDKLNPSGLNISATCSLNTKFNDRSYADWSKTNLISFVTLDGIYILKPQLDNKNGSFKISLIRNPANKFQHEVVGRLFPKFDSIWRTLGPQQYLEVFLDPALATNIDSISLDLYPRRFRLARWSPVINTFPKQCLLAAITLDYQLLIFKFINDTWSGEQVDLSKIYDSLWLQMNQEKLVVAQNGHLLKPSCGGGDELPNLSTENEDLEFARKSIYALSFCNFCWKEMELGTMPYLVAATITGDFVIWRVDLNAPKDNQFDVVTIIKTNSEFICSMQFLDNLLVTAVRDGQVLLYDLTPNFTTDKPDLAGIDTLTADDPMATSCSNEVKTLNLVELQPIATLWHRDNIEVQDFYIEALKPDVYRFVLTKATNICWCIIKYSKKTSDQPATLAISDSFSAIDGLDPDVALHQTAVTWLRPAGQNRAILIADDGSFFQIEFIDQCQETIPDFQAIRTGKTDLTHMVPRALCTSMNGLLHAMVSSLTLQYEPAKILAPTKLILLPTQNDSRFFVDCMNKLMDEDWLRDQQVISLMDVSDRLDYLRAAFLELSSQQLYQVSSIMRKAIEEIDYPKDEVSFIKLKIANFILLKMAQSTSVGSNFLSDTLHERANHNINSYHLDSRFEGIFTKPCKNANADQLNSMQNYLNWLKMDESRNQRLIAKYGQQIKRFLENNSHFSARELCQICQASVPFSALKTGTCENGHQFYRCARSFITPDLRQGDQLVCDHCQRHYSTNLVWPTEKHLWLCLYCQ